MVDVNYYLQNRRVGAVQCNLYLEGSVNKTEHIYSRTE